MKLFTTGPTDALSEQLQHFRFPGFPSLPTKMPPRTARSLNSRMADLTPLSISQPLDKKTEKIQSDQVSYEAKIKKGGFMPDDSQKHVLASVDKPHEGEKPSNYQAVSSSCFATPGPPSLKPRLTNSEAALSTGLSSSALPSARPTKERMAIITDEDGYRPIVPHSHPSDQEKDSNDEYATESDLETHADDDDFNYAADPEEDEGYDSLQSQFRNVKIRKRQRDEVVDVENDNEAWRSDDTARSIHGPTQKILRHGKKSRIAEKLSVADGQHAHGG